MAPEPGERFDIRRSLHEMWRDLKMWVKGESPDQISPRDRALYNHWRELAEYRQGLEERLASGSIEEAQAALSELKFKTETYQQLLQEQAKPIRNLLGKNFFGAEEWEKALGVSVGRPPPIPPSITKELLESACPFNKRMEYFAPERVAETHMLVLMPKTVDGLPYTALELATICHRVEHARGETLLSEEQRAQLWKREAWAKRPQECMEWVLLAREEPNEYLVDIHAHFRSKPPERQQEVLDEKYPKYRCAKALETMTAVILNWALNSDTTVLSAPFVRCAETTADNERVLIGTSMDEGAFLEILINNDPDSGDWIPTYHIGMALAYK
jgi:hypothetical protein